jgi:hypothetical protein
VNGLATIANRLAELKPPDLSPGDVADFRDAVQAVREVESDSVDRLMRSGKQLVSALRTAGRGRPGA